MFNRLLSYFTYILSAISLFFTFSCSGGEEQKNLPAPISEVIDNGDYPSPPAKWTLLEGKTGKGSLKFGGFLGNEIAIPCDITMSPDEKHLYVTDYRGKIAWLNPTVQNGQLKFIGSYGDSKLNGAMSPILSSNGKHLYVAGSKSSSISWFSRDSATGKLEIKGTEIRSDLSGIRKLLLSPDGKNLYALSKYSGSIVWFSRNSSNGAITYKGSFSNDYTKGAWSMVISSDGKNVYVGAYTSGAVVVFTRDTSTGKLTYCEKHQNLYLAGTVALALSSNNKILYALSNKKNTISWLNRDLNTGKLTETDNYEVTSAWGTSWGGKKELLTMTMAPNGKTLYLNSGYSVPIESDGSLKSTGSVSNQFPNTSTNLNTLHFCFSSDGSHKYSVSLKRRAIIADNWNSSGKRFEYAGAYFSSRYAQYGGLEISSDGKNLYFQNHFKEKSGTPSINIPEIMKFNLDQNTGKPSLVKGNFKYLNWNYSWQDSSTHLLQPSPDGKFIYSILQPNDYNSSATKIYLFSIDSSKNPVFQKEIVPAKPTNGTYTYRINCFVMSPNGELVVCSSKGIYKRDATTGDLTLIETPWGSASDYFHIRSSNLWFTPKGASGSSLQSFSGTLFYYPILNGLGCQKLTFTADGKAVVRTQDGQDGEEELGVSDGDEESPYKGISVDGNFSMVVSPDGKFIYAACKGDQSRPLALYHEDGGAIGWFSRDENTGALDLGGSYRDPKVGGVSSIAMTKDGKYIYVGCSSRGIIAWFSRNEDTGELTYLGRYGNSECLYGVRSMKLICDSTGKGKFLYCLGEKSRTLAWFKIMD